MPGGKFIARDKRGAQLSVEVGSGIPEIQPVPGSDTNYKVVFTVAHLKFPTYGYLSTIGNNELLTLLRTAEKEQEDIYFRIESRRKPSVDAHRAWQDLDHKQHIRKLLVQAGGVWSSEVIHDLADDVTPTDTLLTPHLVSTNTPDFTPSPQVIPVVERIYTFIKLQPELAPMMVAVAVATSQIPVPELNALLIPHHTTTRPLSPTSPGQMLFDPGYDTVASADTLAKQPRTAPALTTPIASIASLSKLVKLMRLSGVDPTEVATWIRVTYSVVGVQHLPEEELQVLLSTYRVMGPERGPVAFAHDVRSLA